MSERYFDDFQVGERFETAGCTLSESQILDFAFTYDPQPFHIDVEAAARSNYAGLIASGFQTLLITFRLFYQANVINACSLGSPAMDEVRWLLPVRPGDTLHCRAEVLAMRPSKSRSDRGWLTMAYATINQHGETVMSYRINHMLARRPAAAEVKAAKQAK